MRPEDRYSKTKPGLDMMIENSDGTITLNFREEQPLTFRVKDGQMAVNLRDACITRVAVRGEATARRVALDLKMPLRQVRESLTALAHDEVIEAIDMVGPTEREPLYAMMAQKD